MFNIVDIAAPQIISKTDTTYLLTTMSFLDIGRLNAYLSHFAVLSYENEFIDIIENRSIIIPLKKFALLKAKENTI
jgi:hypothetical protein